MRTLTTKFALLALAASLPAAARAAAAPVGAKYEKTIWVDAVEKPLREPEGVACDDKGALVIADTGNARLLTYRWKDGVLTGGQEVRLGELKYPFRVQIDSKGFVLALDRRSKKIVRIDEKRGFGGFIEPKGAPAAITPLAFRVGPGDDLYVLDVIAAKVSVLAADGAFKRELPLPAGASGVTDVAVDAAGRVYVVDAVSATVYSAEKDGAAFKPISTGLKDSVSFPTYIAPDNRGKLYLVDQNGHAVVRLGIDGSFQGRELQGGWVDGALHYPAQLCIGTADDLFIADRENNRVQIFRLTR